MLYYVTGDMFAIDYQAYVNTVNCVGVMGKGVALQFKNRWPENYWLYRDACFRDDEFKLTPGGIFVTKCDNAPVIVNMATKNHWRDPSRLRWVETGIMELSSWLILNPDIKSLAMPAPGCGNGGLRPRDVKPIIDKYLSGQKANIYVYNLRL